MTITPIRIEVVRHKCPCCSKSYANKSATTAHIGRCWWNPANRGCKTCEHFIGRMGYDTCGQGVDLAGRRACPGCGGYGLADTNSGGQFACNSERVPDHIGDGREVKPGPITGCAEWEPGIGYEDDSP